MKLGSSSRESSFEKQGNQGWDEGEGCQRGRGEPGEGTKRAGERCYFGSMAGCQVSAHHGQTQTNKKQRSGRAHNARHSNSICQTVQNPAQLGCSQKKLVRYNCTNLKMWYHLCSEARFFMCPKPGKSMRKLSKRAHMCKHKESLTSSKKQVLYIFQTNFFFLILLNSLQGPACSNCII